MIAAQLDLAIGRNHQPARIAQVAEQVVQQRERAVIGPVQIVDEQQQAVLGGERAEETRHLIEQAQPLLVRRQRRIGLDWP